MFNHGPKFRWQWTHDLKNTWVMLNRSNSMSVDSYDYSRARSSIYFNTNFLGGSGKNKYEFPMGCACEETSHHYSHIWTYFIKTSAPVMRYACLKFFLKWENFWFFFHISFMYNSIESLMKERKGFGYQLYFFVSNAELSINFFSIIDLKILSKKNTLNTEKAFKDAT